MQKKLLAALTVLALNQAAGATDMERLRFSGFGTLGVVHSNDKSADFRSNIEQASGPGLTHKIDSGLDSVFGAQADINLLPGLTGTAQVISRRLSDMNLSKPYFEWANVKYQATRDLYVRGGRIVAPMFLISESRMVGYGQTAVRPSDEVYTINPVTYINGADIGYRFEGGPVLFKIGAAGGTLTQTITSGTATSKYYFNAKLFNGSAEYKGSTFRAGYAKLAIDIKSDMFAVRNAALDKLVANKVPNAYMVQENTATNNVNVDFYNLGYVYDRDQWLFQAEFGSRKSDKDGIVDMDGVWLLAGYRLGKFTPYLSWSKMSHKSAISLPTLDTSLLATTAEKNSVNAVNTNFMQRFDRGDIAAGLRWDVLENVALKVQMDRIHKGAGGQAYFVNGTAEFAGNNRTINLYSATLDYVF